MSKNAKAKVDNRSMVQIYADDMREISLAIEESKAEESRWAAEAQQCEFALMNAKTNLADTRALLSAQQNKLHRLCCDMHTIVERGNPVNPYGKDATTDSSVF